MGRPIKGALPRDARITVRMPSSYLALLDEVVVETEDEELETANDAVNVAVAEYLARKGKGVEE